MNLQDFVYELPEALIAQTPIEPRDASRLMVWDAEKRSLSHRHFYDVLDYLSAGDALVVNETRVMPARLLGKREGGGACEVLLLHQLAPKRWETLVKPGKKLRAGAKMFFGGDALIGTVLAPTDAGGRIVEFECEGAFEAALDALGETPLPPYIREKLENPERYQTVYARETGSAAAPTAGLHFTDSLIEKAKAKGIEIIPILLHVGLGTFRPVKVEKIESHKMHSEFYSISEEAASRLNRIRAGGGRIFAVGTTCVRTLETVALKGGAIVPGSGWTDIFIYPGFRFKAVDAMVTNFHLPGSTLLMLVSAFMGRGEMMDAYGEAVREKYRFFSFGDAMLIIGRQINV